MNLTAAYIALLAVWAQVALAQQQAKPRPVAAAAAADPPGSLHAAIAKSAPQFRSLLDIVKLAPQNFPKNAVGTLFAPSDVAVAAFLKGMGFTAADLVARPDLVDLIVSYHFVPGYQVTGAEVGPKKAATGDDNYVVTLDKSKAGKVTVTDVQGNIATVVSGPVTVGKVSVYVIDQVLMSGNYFKDTLSALKFYPSWVTAYGLAQRAGVDKVLASTKDPYTLFVPNVKAWKPVELKLEGASAAQLAEIFKYHVVLGALQAPKDFKDGSLPTLLPGHSLLVTVNATATAKDPFRGGAEVVEPAVVLIPEVGVPAKVVTYNIYAGNNIIHAINHVLQPDVTATPTGVPGKPTSAPPNSKIISEAATKAAVAAPAAATTTPAAKPSAAAAEGGAPTTAPGATAPAAKPSSTTTSLAAGSPAAAAAVPKPAGRRLRALNPGRQLQQVSPLTGVVTGRTTPLGSVQTRATGFTSTRVLDALNASATGKVPLQYSNRFGSLPVSSAPNGCVNCLVWTKP